jgi:hypothetical protein
MIKARAGNTVIFGLSKLNLEKLQEGKPIAIDGAHVGLDGTQILIMYGETELAIIHELEEAIGDGQTNSLS